MSSYKITYYDFRGRDELMMWMFALADQPYEDIRINKRLDTWSKMNPDSKFGIMPILEVDGVELCQSKAIARFLANKFGFAGKNELEKAQVDMIADCTDDMTRDPVTIVGLRRYKNKPELADEMKKDYLENQLPVYLTYFERMLKSNNGGNGYLVGDALTWADLSLVDTLRSWFKATVDVKVDLSEYPKLAALKDRVLSLPKIADWVERFPHRRLD